MRDIGQAAADMNLIKHETPSFAGNFRREEGVGNLGIKDGGVEAGVNKIYGSLKVGYAPTRDVPREDMLPGDARRLSQEIYHRPDGIDAYIHDGAPGAERVERGGDFSSLQGFVLG